MINSFAVETLVEMLQILFINLGIKLNFLDQASIPYDRCKYNKKNIVKRINHGFPCESRE